MTPRQATLLVSLASVLFLTTPALAQQGSPEKAAKIFGEAEAHYKRHEYEKALSGYQQAYELSKEPVLLFNIAQCYRLLARYDEAIASYRAYLEAVPGASNKAPVEAQIEELEALIAEARAIEIFQQADVSYKVGDFQKALDGYKEAYRLVQKPSLLFNIAQCHRQLGSYTEAIATYRAFLRDEPTTPLKEDVEALIAESEAKEKDRQARVSQLNAPPQAPSLLDSPYLQPRYFFYGGAAAGAVTLVAGGVAVVSSLQSAAVVRVELNEQPDFGRLFLLVNRAEKFAELANRAALVAVAAGGVGYLLSRRAEARASVGLSLGPTAFSLSVRW